MARILIVDDERDVVTLLRFLLEREGHEVDEAYNGSEALSKVAAQPPDLMIVDVMMPILDGYSLSVQLAQDPKTRAVPVIILTAKGGTHELFQKSPNVAACLEKPFEPKKLRELIAGALR